eukprot:5518442-Heterocapsa_arctica.AAC.1
MVIAILYWRLAARGDQSPGSRRPGSMNKQKPAHRYSKFVFWGAQGALSSSGVPSDWGPDEVQQ